MAAFFKYRTHMTLLTLIFICTAFLAALGFAGRKRGRKPAGERFRLDTDIRLTVKSVIRWEQLRGKSFYSMDYRDPEDIEALLYTLVLAGGKACTFEVFKGVLSQEKIAREIMAALHRESAVLAQFQKSREKEAGEGPAGEPGTVSDIVATLVIAGLDAHYALNEMELCDLALYVRAFDRREREKMESARFWTYTTMLPHIDARKMKNGARDLVVFPWEEEEARREAERSLREDLGRFEEFMKTKKSHYYGRKVKF